MQVESRKESLGCFWGKKGGDSCARRVVLAVHNHRIPSAQYGMSTVLLLPQLLLKPPCT